MLPVTACPSRDSVTPDRSATDSSRAEAERGRGAQPNCVGGCNPAPFGVRRVDRGVVLAPRATRGGPVTQQQTVGATRASTNAPADVSMTFVGTATTLLRIGSFTLLT